MANKLQTAISLQQQGQFTEAEILYNELIRQHNDPNAWNLLGVLYYNRKRYKAGIDCIKKAIKQVPDAAAFHFNLAIGYSSCKKNELALQHLKQCIRYDTNFINAYVQAVNILLQQEKFNQAKKYVQQAMQIAPDNIQVMQANAYVYECQNNLIQAEQINLQILKIQPDNCITLNNLSHVLCKLGKYTQATNIVKKLLKINPQDSNGWNNFGNILMQQNKILDSVECFAKSIEIDDSMLAKTNLASAFRAIKNFIGAKNIYLQLDKSNPKVIVGLAICYVGLCEWQELKILYPKLKSIIRKNTKSELLQLVEGLMLRLDLDLQQHIAKLHANKHMAIASNCVLHPQTNNTSLINIGYLSADFGLHPVGLLVNNLFKYHDRARYKVHVLSLSNHNDEINQNIRNTADQYIDLSNLEDQELLDKISNLQLDIVIDLSGATKSAKPWLLCKDIALLKISWLGYVGSQQTSNYYLTAKQQVGNNYEYKEKLLLMPNFIACDLSMPAFKLPQVSPNRSDYGLPEDAIVYCCFNQIYRICEDTFNAWLDILQQVPDSVLWLNSAEIKIQLNLQRLAAQANIDPNRIIFKPPTLITSDWHIMLADIYLDTWFESGGTTTVFACRVGLPLVTIAGSRAETRVAAAILHTANMAHCVVDSPSGYISTAVELATNNDLLNKLRQDYKSRVENCDLFKPQQFIAQLEQVLDKEISCK